MRKVENQSLILPSASIQMSGQITLLQAKAWDLMLFNAYNDLLKQDKFQLSIGELAKILEFDSNDLEKIKEAIRGLIDFKVEWNILRKDKKVSWGVASMIADAVIENGICTYSYGASFKEKLYNPKVYTKIKVLRYLEMKFKSKYGLKLFKLCLDYVITNKGSGETPWIPLEIFRKLIGVEDHEYKTFKSLAQWTIKPALKEVNTLSDLVIEKEYKKDGKQIIAVKFYITVKTNSEIKNTLKEMQEEESETTLFDKLITIGMNKNTANDFIKKYSPLEVQLTLEYLKNYEGTIEDVSALARSCIEKKYWKTTKKQTDPLPKLETWWKSLDQNTRGIFASEYWKKYPQDKECKAKTWGIFKIEKYNSRIKQGELF